MRMAYLRQAMTRFQRSAHRHEYSLTNPETYDRMEQIHIKYSAAAELIVTPQRGS
jgi:hypothetical protein